MFKQAKDLEEGDLVDLEGDKYADPKRDHIQFECELQTVASVDFETPNCIAVGFEGWDVCGFPPEHTLKVAPYKAY